MDAFLKLPLEEQRRRILLRPAYLDVSNEIIQPDRVTIQSHYFWRRWAPKLGPIAAMLFLRLRQCCAANRDAGPGRDWCFPSQIDLARELGIGRKWIRRCLRELASLGLIRREPTFRYDPKVRRSMRAPDRYHVLMEDPLAPEDAGRLFAEAAERISNGRALDQLGLPIPEWASEAHSETFLTAHGPLRPSVEWASEAQQLPNVNAKENVNVQHRECQRNGEWGTEAPVRPQQHDPAPSRGLTRIGEGSLLSRLALEPEESPAAPLRRGAELALEIAEELGDHRSLRFYARVASRLPEPVIRQALSETKAARLERRLRGRPGAFFTGAVQSLAKELGIEL